MSFLNLKIEVIVNIAIPTSRKKSKTFLILAMLINQVNHYGKDN